MGRAWNKNRYDSFPALLLVYKVLRFRAELEEGKLVQKMNGNYKQEAEFLGKQLSALCIERAKGALQFAVRPTISLSYCLLVYSHYRRLWSIVI